MPIGRRDADAAVMQTWVLVLAAWTVLSVPAAVVLGRGVRLADARSAGAGRPLTTADLPEGFRPAGLPRP